MIISNFYNFYFIFFHIFYNMQNLPQYERLVITGVIKREGIRLPSYSEALSMPRGLGNLQKQNSNPIITTKDGMEILSLSPLVEDPILPIEISNNAQDNIQSVIPPPVDTIKEQEYSDMDLDEKEDDDVCMEILPKKETLKPKKKGFRQRMGSFFKKSKEALVPPVEVYVYQQNPGNSSDKKKKKSRRLSKIKKNIPSINEETLHAVGEEILKLTNEYRASKGIDVTLNWSEELYWIACQHSLDMSEGTVPFGHDGFRDRVEQFPFTSMRSAENVFMCTFYPTEELANIAVDSWINSPGHEANLRGNFDTCAIGICRNDSGKYYFTQLFGLH